MTGGRPIRFLVVLLCGWAGVRGYAIYRDGGVTALPLAGPLARIVAAIGAAPATAAPSPYRATAARRTAWVAAIGGRGAASPSPIAAPAAVAAPSRSAGIVADPWTADQRPAAPPRLAPAVQPPPIARGPSRLAGSAWLIARGGDASSVTVGQLGGSQAGVRVSYALGTARRVALAARVSAPLSGRGREAAIGLDWQPTRAPIHVVAERRIALDGARGGSVVGVIGGFGPVRIAPPLTLEGYGQAGVIDRDGIEGFADGALRAAHPLGAVGPVTLDVGVGLWGGAQRAAARLDVGPSLGAVVRLGGRSMRLAVDWRERIAGASRPDSGPALSIGTNF